MANDCRNRVAPREGMTEEQVASLSFRERLLDLLDVIRAV